MYAIKRPINGISINGFEYLLSPGGNEMVFASEGMAHDFIAKSGYDGDYTVVDLGEEEESDVKA